MMRVSRASVGVVALLGLVAMSGASQAGWSERMSATVAPAVGTRSLLREPPLAENFKFPTKADRVQGMAPYEALAGGSSTAAPPPPVMVPASPDPVYFGTVMGSSR